VRRQTITSVGKSFLVFLASLTVLAPLALGDTGGAVSATLVILGGTPGGDEGEEVAGGGGAAECEPLCPPPIPALYATKRSDLVQDINENGVVDPGDTVRYTMLVTNFAPVPMTGIDYVDLLDPHVRFVDTSWSSTRGDATIGVINGAQALVATIGTLDPLESVIFSFDALVDGNLDGSIEELVGQGTVYPQTTSPIVTDDPTTALLQDATRTPVGTGGEIIPAGWGASVLEPPSGALKAARILPEGEVLRVADWTTLVEYGIGFANTTGEALQNVRLVDLVGPHLVVQTDSLVPSSARVTTLGSVQIVSAVIPELPAGESATIRYRAVLRSDIPAEVAYTASRAVVSCTSTLTQLSDDPETQLLNDPTAVLFPYRCALDETWTWDDWLSVVSQAPTGLLPLVMQEKDESQHLRWVLYGGDFFGDLSVQPSLRPPYWPEWSLVGLVEVPFEVAKASALGFRLARRDEPYVKNFLSEEPLFMWTKASMPLYGRVPATDAGSLLWCDGFNRDYCDQGYLPLLTQLNWSEDWDMRWLEDALIVATVTEEGAKP